MYELAKKRPVTTLQPRRMWKYGKIGKKKTLKENFLELFIYLGRTFRDFNAEVMSPGPVMNLRQTTRRKLTLN